MDRGKTAVAAGAAAVLLVAAGGIVVFGGGGSQTDCDTLYNQTLEGEMEASELPERCEPLPEDVRNQLLVQAFADSQSQ